VEVLDAGQLVPLSGTTILTLLAGLLISPNRVIPAQTLTEWVWGAALPAHPRAALHSGVSRLRRLVGPDIVETRAWGYRLRIDACRLDLLHFDRLLAVADEAVAAGLADQAVTALDEAVGLWRAPLLGNIDSPTLRREVLPRLTERYLGAVEERAELRLRLGRGGALGALAEELSEAVRAHPFRERIVGQLMVALVRSGRQVDALAAYDTLRRALNEELGIDPLPALQDLRVKILRADPGLDTTPARAGRAH
jgi:DNA-binding SARP family transcriptional activator